MKTKIACVSILSLALSACGDGQQQNAEISPPSPVVQQPDAVEPAIAPATEKALDSSIKVFSYADIATAQRGKAACFLGSIDGDPAGNQVEIQGGDQHTLEGWTADESMTVPESVEFVIASADVAYAMPATLGPDKSRAAEVFNNPALANSGYTAILKSAGMKPGLYKVFIKQTTGAVVGYCPVSSKSIAIK